jgi:hypothetical protein
VSKGKPRFVYEKISDNSLIGNVPDFEKIKSYRKKFSVAGKFCDMGIDHKYQGRKHFIIDKSIQLTVPFYSHFFHPGFKRRSI